MKTQITIRIADRKAASYPTESYIVEFDGDLDAFIDAVDQLIDSRNIRKADVYIDTPEQFNDDELETLQEMDFII